MIEANNDPKRAHESKYNASQKSLKLNFYYVQSVEKSVMWARWQTSQTNKLKIWDKDHPENYWWNRRIEKLMKDLEKCIMEDQNDLKGELGVEDSYISYKSMMPQQQNPLKNQSVIIVRASHLVELLLFQYLTVILALMLAREWTWTIAGKNLNLRIS